MCTTLSREFKKAFKNLQPLFEAEFNNIPSSYPKYNDYTGSKGWFKTTGRFTPKNHKDKIPDIFPFKFGQSKKSQIISSNGITILLRKYSVRNNKNIKCIAPRYKLWIGEIIDSRTITTKNCYWIEKSEFNENYDDINNNINGLVDKVFDYLKNTAHDEEETLKNISDIIGSHKEYCDHNYQII